MRPVTVRLFRSLRLARVAWRGLASVEWCVATWLCLVFLAHLALTNTLLSHRQRYRGQTEATSSLPNATNASHPCPAKCFRRRVAAPLLWNTPQLVRHIRRLIHHRHHHAHTPTHHDPPPITREAYRNPASQKLEQDLMGIIGSRKGGVYVVVGAGGREWQYLTRRLEDLGWRGLMVEANAYNLAQQQAGHALAPLLHACITHDPLPMTRRLWRPSGADLPGVGAALKRALEEHVMLEEYVPAQEKPLGSTHDVTCFPLETVVLSLSASTVDVLVLDAPGLADDLLLSLTRKRFKVKVVVVRTRRLENGLDERRYSQMAEDVGLLLLAWQGSYVVLAHPSANIRLQVVHS